MAIPTLIFDLDGTISDPGVGIARSINFALSAFGYAAIDEKEVGLLIGAPLDDAFRTLVPDAGSDLVVALVSKYRERYGDVGYSENVVYEGIPEALAYLDSRGIPMGVCTSKRDDFAERILEHFSLRHHFAFVSGGEVGVRKNDQLRALLERGLVTEGATVIGDRAVDVLAAHANSLRSVGVLWGYGSRQELLSANPARLIEAPADLKDMQVTKPAQGYDVRLAAAHDVSSLPEIERTAGLLYKTYHEDLGIPDDVYEQVTSVETFAEAQRQGRLWVATDAAGEIVGFALVTELAGHAHLDEIDVLPEHGGRGVGSALLSTVCSWAKEKGCSAVTLRTFRVVPWNGPFYARRGFGIVESGSLSERHLELEASERRRGLRTDLRVTMALSMKEG